MTKQTEELLRPVEAFEYNDDVVPDVVQRVRDERGVDTSAKSWRSIEVK